MLPAFITLHTAWLHELTPQHDTFAATLSPDERARAERLRFDEPRAQFVLARGFLRMTLAEQINVAPAEIRFSYGKRGKPGIDRTHHTDAGDLRFNLAHSHDLVVLAITHGHEIGVDVEKIRPMPNMVTMARDNFSQKEQNTLFSLPPEQQLNAFFHIWTRKEAYIKATGDGFSHPLSDFDVTHDTPPQITRAGDQWKLHQLDIDPGYVAAVCINDSAD